MKKLTLLMFFLSFFLVYSGMSWSSEQQVKSNKVSKPITPQKQGIFESSFEDYVKVKGVKSPGDPPKGGGSGSMPPSAEPAPQPDPGGSSGEAPPADAYPTAKREKAGAVTSIKGGEQSQSLMGMLEGGKIKSPNTNKSFKNKIQGMLDGDVLVGRVSGVKPAGNKMAKKAPKIKMGKLLHSKP